MSRFIGVSFLCTLMVLIASVSYGQGVKSEGDSEVITVVYSGDLHGELLPKKQ